MALVYTGKTYQSYGKVVSRLEHFSGIAAYILTDDLFWPIGTRLITVMLNRLLTKMLKAHR